MEVVLMGMFDRYVFDKRKIFEMRKRWIVDFRNGGYRWDFCRWVMDLYGNDRMKVLKYVEWWEKKWGYDYCLRWYVSVYRVNRDVFMRLWNGRNCRNE